MGQTGLACTLLQWWHPHMQLLIKGLFGGRIFWSFVISLEELLIAKLGMDLLFFSGQTYGMTMSCRITSLDFSPLPKIRRFLCCSFFQTTTLSHNFTSHCLNKLTKNTKQCKTIFKLYMFNRTQKIPGTIFRAAAAILLLNSTTSPTEMFSLLPLSCGFGIQSAVTNLKSSPDSWLWIG